MNLIIPILILATLVFNGVQALESAINTNRNLHKRNEVSAELREIDSLLQNTFSDVRTCREGLMAANQIAAGSVGTKPIAIKQIQIAPSKAKAGLANIAIAQIDNGILREGQAFGRLTFTKMELVKFAPIAAGRTTQTGYLELTAKIAGDDKFSTIVRIPMMTFRRDDLDNCYVPVKMGFASENLPDNVCSVLKGQGYKYDVGTAECFL